MQPAQSGAQRPGGDSLFSWLFRLIKGIVIGTGFIIPGVSGGVFAAIFGVYEPMIRFFANIRKNFLKNMLFFLPIGVGVLISMVVCSSCWGRPLSATRCPLLWFFIGCVLGTALYQQAGQEGRQSHHGILIITVIICPVPLLHRGWLSNITIHGRLWVWLIQALIDGAIVPGTNPSISCCYMVLGA